MVQIKYFAVILMSLKAVEGSMEPFVVGGGSAIINKFPHSVFLDATCYVTKDKEPIYWICGASILNQKVVMTAAHCMHGCVHPSVYSVHMGHAHKDKGFSSLVKSYILHKEYAPHSTSNDIGLAALTTSIKFNVNVKRIAVMKRPPYFEKAQLAGWGLVNELTASLDDNLRYIDQFVWERKACWQVLRELPYGTICASSGYPSIYASRSLKPFVHNIGIENKAVDERDGEGFIKTWLYLPEFQ